MRSPWDLKEVGDEVSDLSFDMVLETVCGLVNTATSRKAKIPFFLTAACGDNRPLSVLRAQGSARVRGSDCSGPKMEPDFGAVHIRLRLSVISSNLDVPSIHAVCHHRPTLCLDSSVTSCSPFCEPIIIYFPSF